MVTSRLRGNTNTHECGRSNIEDGLDEQTGDVGAHFSDLRV